MLHILYDGEEIGKVVTNHSMTLQEACNLAGIDLDETLGGDPVYDLAKFEMIFD